MNLSLIPPVGVPPLLLGMSSDEAAGAMGSWGVPELLEGPTNRLRVCDRNLNLDVFAHLGSDGRLTAIEVWRPEDIDSDVQVTFEGIEVFVETAESVLNIIRLRGFRVDDSDPYCPSCPDLTLGFNREGGNDVDRDGLARYFESILVAGPGYYG
ncbi:hypothetical protein [Nocardia sp. R7R-8]|uniref:hypothetical protein n=1 Tax=Nocardia sp. R7R-8 TaxID=3459304 RepID=UPI00403E1B75